MAVQVPLTRRRWVREIAVHAGRVLAILLALWLLASWTMEKVSVHPRHSSDGPTPARYGLTYRDVSFKDAAGLTLRGWWIPGTRHATVVMVHGWTTSRQEPMSKGRYLHDAGYNLLLFDLRGHGASDGDYTSFGWTEYQDAITAVRFARGLDEGPVALFGYSMGAATVVMAAARGADVNAVVEDSGYSSLVDVIASSFSLSTHLPADPFVDPMLAIAQADLGFTPSAIRPIDDARRLTAPMLVIHSSDDRLVPLSQGLALYDAAGGPRELLVVEGGTHAAGYFKDTAAYEAKVLGFLDQYMV